MRDSRSISSHYTHGRLLAVITEGLARMGKGPDSVRVEDLGPVDEFHIGGRAASEHLLDQLRLAPRDHVLDVGCGLGGASRFVAHRYGSRVTGIDLTPEYIAAGRALCAWVGLGKRITLQEGNATALPYPDGTFDKAYMMHVGMNIADKKALMVEVHRVLKPGARLAVYDVMRIGEGDLLFPVPWASTAAASVVGSPDEYRQALSAAGFRLVAEENRHAFALDFFTRLQASLAAGGPPALGLHLLMGETAPRKMKNMIENIREGRVAPVEMIVERASKR